MKGKKYFFPLLECFQHEAGTTKSDQPLKKGRWWLMIKVTNKRIWQDIESGKLTGFSMGGRGKSLKNLTNRKVFFILNIS